MLGRIGRIWLIATCLTALASGCSNESSAVFPSDPLLLCRKPLDAKKETVPAEQLLVRDEPRMPVPNMALVEASRPAATPSLPPPGSVAATSNGETTIFVTPPIRVTLPAEVKAMPASRQKN